MSSGRQCRELEQLQQSLRRVELAGQYQRAARARQSGQRPVHLAALEHLSLAGGLTPGMLGHRLGLTSGGVTALTARLIAAGQVADSLHPEDRRMKMLATTHAGDAHLAQEIGPVFAAADPLFRCISEQDAALLATFLDSLAVLKERAAEATPAARPSRTRRPYSRALLA
jgi:DNA-binding MarR family transcriptional regulator